MALYPEVYAAAVADAAASNGNGDAVANEESPAERALRERCKKRAAAQTELCSLANERLAQLGGDYFVHLQFVRGQNPVLANEAATEKTFTDADARYLGLKDASDQTACRAAYDANSQVLDPAIAPNFDSILTTLIARLQSKSGSDWMSARASVLAQHPRLGTASAAR